MYCHIQQKFCPERHRFYSKSMYCVRRTNHTKFAKQTSANFQNIQHQKVHTFFFWNQVYFGRWPLDDVTCQV